jgi:hypothetical protein
MIFPFIRGECIASNSIVYLELKFSVVVYLRLHLVLIYAI